MRMVLLRLLNALTGGRVVVECQSCSRVHGRLVKHNRPPCPPIATFAVDLTPQPNMPRNALGVNERVADINRKQKVGIHLDYFSNSGVSIYADGMLVATREATPRRRATFIELPDVVVARTISIEAAGGFRLWSFKSLTRREFTLDPE